MGSDDQPATGDANEWDSAMAVDDLYEDLGEPGFLTRGDRELLLGKKDYSDKAQERKARARLRNRIQTGLKDFVLLARKIDPKDRKQIIADITDYSEYPDTVYRKNEVQGIRSAIAFLYSVAADAGYGFERVVEDGIFTALQWSQQHSAPYPNVVVEISIEPIEQDQEAFVKLRENEPLTRTEYHLLRRYVIDNRGRFLLETEDIEVPTEKAVSEDRYLSRGHSLIAFARTLVDPEWLELDTEVQVVDPEVLADFGISAAWRPSVKREGETEDSPPSTDELTAEDVADEL